MTERRLILGNEVEFCFAHRLKDDKTMCFNLHGHNALVRVELMRTCTKGEMVIHLDNLDELLRRYIFQTFDHMMILQHDDPIIETFANKPLINNNGWAQLYQSFIASINSDGYFDTRTLSYNPFFVKQNIVVIAEPPTCENLSYLIHRILSPHLYRAGIEHFKVNFYETLTKYGSFTGQAREQLDFPQLTMEPIKPLSEMPT